MADFKRLALPLGVAVILGGMLVPLAVTRYHDSVVQENQNSAIEALRQFARLQAEYAKLSGHYASSFEDLGGEWAKVQDLISRNPTEFQGYRFRLFVPAGAGGGKRGTSYAIMAVPARYGFTGRFTFFLSAPGKPVYYYDFGVKTDTAARQLGEYYVPKDAGTLELD